MARALIFALALALVAATGSAQPAASGGVDGKLWRFSLAAFTDEDSYANLLASFDLGVTDATWLSLGAGKSRAPAAEADVEARFGSLGIEHRFGLLGFGVRVEDWGDPDDLESRDWQADLILSGDDFRLALTYERRDIDVYFSGAGAPRPTDIRRAALEAEGLGLRGWYLVSPVWRIYGSWMDYDYPRRIAVVPRADRLDLLSASAVTLAYSLVDYYANLGFERAFGYRLFSASLGRDRSAVDAEILESVSASMLWPVARRIDLELTLGRSRSLSFGSSVYGGLSFVIYGG